MLEVLVSFEFKKRFINSAQVLGGPTCKFLFSDAFIGCTVFVNKLSEVHLLIQLYFGWLFNLDHNRVLINYQKR